MKRLLFLFFAAGLLPACKRTSLQAYTEKPRIYAQFGGVKESTGGVGAPIISDTTMLIDFSFRPNTLQSDTIFVSVLITGAAATIDRPLVFERNPAIGNGHEGVDFELLTKNPAIPANAYSTLIELLIHRTPQMTKQSISFAYGLKANENFQLMKSMNLIFSGIDVLTKIRNWDSFLMEFLGTYSEVKFRFMINTFPGENWAYETSRTDMAIFKENLQDALDAYNATHPEKLKDENGIEVSF